MMRSTAALLLAALLLAACAGRPTPTPVPATPVPQDTPAPEATATPTTAPTATPEPPAATPTPTQDPGILAATVEPLPAAATRQAEVAAALEQQIPILPLNSVSDPQWLAQELALQDPRVATYTSDPQNGTPLRSEVFGIYPARDSDLTETTIACLTGDCYRVEIYNYAYNSSIVAMVDIQTQQVLAVDYYPETQPDLPPALVDLAVEIATQSPEVAQALGFAPGSDAAVMPNIKTALNRTLCERSRHLCVAPTFLQDDRALWAIVDITDAKLVGVRWTDLGAVQSPPVTEKTLENNVIYAEFCDKASALARDGWEFDYILTSSDGLRISQVRFNGTPVLDSAKLVDYHVSYSNTEGFGYSDAVGCPIFSQAAVLALEPPRILDIAEDGKVTGFALEQDFQSELWPMPCNYHYRQRYEFYADGRFNVIAGNYGRGCGNDGTYRLVLRIAPSGPQTFSQWDGSGWSAWTTEKWIQQTPDTLATAEGALYRLDTPSGTGYTVTPFWGPEDRPRPSTAYTYVSRRIPAKDEGDADLITIGSCCNEDYRQGPEQFIEPTPDALAGGELALWYVPEMHNDDTPGQEYCWADFALENGVYVPKAWPCLGGLKFTPAAAGQ